MPEPTPEQLEQIRQGCFYECCRIIATILCACMLLYLMPLFGQNIAQGFMLIVSYIGLYYVSSWIMRNFYPDRPLERLQREIESGE